jgi:hypothetical protein
MQEARRAEKIGSGDRLTSGDLGDVIVAILVGCALYAILIWFAITYDEGAMTPILSLFGVCAVSMGWIGGILFFSLLGRGT